MFYWNIGGRGWMREIGIRLGWRVVARVQIYPRTPHPILANDTTNEGGGRRKPRLIYVLANYPGFVKGFIQSLGIRVRNGNVREGTHPIGRDIQRDHARYPLFRL